MGKIILALIFIASIHDSKQYGFEMINKSSGPVQIRIWSNGRLIHDHTMAIGDSFDIQSPSSKFVIQFRKLSNKCTPRDPDTNWTEDKYLGNNWWEFPIDLKNLERPFVLSWVDPECNKLRAYLKQV